MDDRQDTKWLNETDKTVKKKAQKKTKKSARLGVNGVDENQGQRACQAG